MIEEIRRKIIDNQFELSVHALDNSIIRHISVRELRQAFADGRVIEDYPDDKYGPSCLILGYAEIGRPIHINCSHPTRDLIKIITLYEPEESDWIDFKYRRE